MSIRSSWNTDRVAAARMGGKSRAPRRIYKRPTVQVTKESDLYIGDYGEQAYYEWKHREAAIDAMWSSGRSEDWAFLWSRKAWIMYPMPIKMGKIS